VSGWGERLGERPRGDFVRWVPKLAAACVLGVTDLFGTGKGPVWVGVMARVDAAMSGGDGGERYVVDAWLGVSDATYRPG
jgi:hypothetical protein